MSNSPEDSDAGFQIAPMVDIVFVLLLFFMASAGSQLIPKELSIDLPSGGMTPDSKHLVPVIVDIAADGSVKLNSRAFDSASSRDLPALKGFFRESIAKFGDRDPVILRPDPQAKQGRIIDVLNAVSAAGVKRLSFS